MSKAPAIYVEIVISDDGLAHTLAPIGSAARALFGGRETRVGRFATFTDAMRRAESNGWIVLLPGDHFEARNAAADTIDALERLWTAAPDDIAGEELRELIFTTGICERYLDARTPANQSNPQQQEDR